MKKVGRSGSGCLINGVEESEKSYAVLQAEESMVPLTRYSKTSVSDFGVCTIS